VSSSRGISELVTTVILILIVIVAAAILYIGYTSYTSRAGAQISQTITSQLRGASTSLSIVYVYANYSATTNNMSLHLFLAVAGGEAVLQGVYVDSIPFNPSVVRVYRSNGTLLFIGTSLPLAIKPGVYHVVLSGVAPLNLTGRSTVLVRITSNIGIYDYQAPLIT